MVGQLPVFPLRTRPFDAGRFLAFGIREVRCFGGVLSKFLTARWKRSSIPGSSWIFEVSDRGFSAM
jgi:hypothetical protein